MVIGSPSQHRVWRSGLHRVAGLLVAVAAAAVLGDQAARALQVITSGTSSQSTGFGGPWWVAAAGVAVLAAVGALPAWRLVGSRPLAVFLAPCLGAVVAALSVVVTVVVASDPLRWFVALAAAINAAALSSVAAPRDRRDQRRVGPPWSLPSAVVVTLVLLATAVAGVVGYAATAGGGGSGGRTTWLALAGVIGAGHGGVHRAVTASTSAGARLLASPLASGAASITWMVTGRRAAGAADVVIAALTLSAVGAAACAVTEMARTISHGLDRHSAGRPRTRAVQLSGLLGAAGWVLAAFWGLAAAGGQVVDATVTLLWASAAVGSVAFGLVLSTDRWRLRAVVVLGAMSTLAAPEGGVAAAAVALAVTLRRVVAARRRGSGTGWWADVLGGTVAVVGAVAWPVAGAVVGAVPIRFAALSIAHLSRRLSSTWAILQPHLAAVAVALGVAALAAVILRRDRATREIGSDVGSVVVGVASLGAVLVAWSWPAPVLSPWRVAAVPTAAVFPLLLASLSMATWMVTGVAVATGVEPSQAAPFSGEMSSSEGERSGRSSSEGERSGVDSSEMGSSGRSSSEVERSGVDGAGPGVLHPSP